MISMALLMINVSYIAIKYITLPNKRLFNVITITYDLSVAVKEKQTLYACSVFGKTKFLVLIPLPFIC